MENENYSLQADEEKKYMSLVTDIGNAAMMKAVTKGEKIEIKEFAVGDGGGMQYIPDTKMTALKNEVWRGQINYCKISEESENVLIINAIISGEVGGFTIREMGVFDTQNRMIAICNTPETPKVRIIDGVVNEMNLLMEIVLVNNAAVELKIDHNIVTATKQEVRDLRDELNERFDNIHETTVSFEESEKRENINSGDKLKVIFGKIKKMISDLKQVAFTGSYNDLKDKPVINMNTINGTLGIEKGGTGATTAQNARANLGLGTAATCAVANNDVTNNTTHLVTAAVAYQHGQEIDKLNSDLQQCFQSASNGKALVAAAISGKGISTAANATYQEMSTNISNIQVKQSGVSINTSYGLSAKTDGPGTFTQTIDTMGYLYANIGRTGDDSVQISSNVGIGNNVSIHGVNTIVVTITNPKTGSGTNYKSGNLTIYLHN